LTGVPCPGCGITSSILALCRGDVLRAWHSHPAGIVVLLYFVSSAAIAIRQ
jgi:hypothetical protein